MTNADRVMLVLMFKFLVKLLFSIFYTVSSQKNENLYKTYKELAAELDKWTGEAAK